MVHVSQRKPQFKMIVINKIEQLTVTRWLDSNQRDEVFPFIRGVEIVSSPAFGHSATP